MTFPRLISAAGLMLGILALPVAPVSAQDSSQESQIGSRFKREKFDTGRNARQTLNYYGRCVAAYKSDEIEAFLLKPTQEAWDSVMNTPNNRTRCAITSVSAAYREFSGSVSEGWYLRRFKEGPPTAFKTGEQTAPPQDEVVARLLSVNDKDKPVILLEEFARCVAATAPLEVDALLRTDVESKAEGPAFASIGPYLGPCAFEGQNLSLDKESLRSLLAFALAQRAALTLNGGT